VEHSITFRDQIFVHPFVVNATSAKALPNWKPADCQLIWRPFGGSLPGYVHRNTITPAEYRVAESYCTMHDIRCPINPARRNVCCEPAVISVDSVPRVDPPVEATASGDAIAARPFRTERPAATAQVARAKQGKATSSVKMPVRQPATRPADDSEEQLPRSKLEEGYMTPPNSPGYSPA